MMIFVRFLAALVIFTCAAAPAALAAPQESDAPEQGGQRTVTVTVRVLPPFVQEQNGRFSGYSVDLWNDIASRQNWKTNFRAAPNVKGQLEDVASGKADVGVGAISITADRAQRFDFSQPIMNSGLQILIRSDRPAPETTALSRILRLLFSPAILVWMGIALLLAAIPAHVVWFFERGHNNGIIQDRSYFPGIFQSLYWSVSAITGSAEAMPRQWIARIFALLWTFTSIVFVAYYTAQLTASLTVERFKAEISGPEDLPGKMVGTVQASTSAAFLDWTGAKVTAFPTIAEAYQALLDRRVVAIVYDAPVLQYMAARQGAGQVKVVGPMFNTADYGFTFRIGSDLRKKVDSTLLLLREDGSYDRLNEAYFGTRETQSSRLAAPSGSRQPQPARP
jgi:polar amino acid transport system substrate-binding protein